ncbi:hypothetical protein CBG57_03365 [Prevotella nigrescens]|uniref:hypothetical protein n=1 Tax=Prevotella nigrescens TaxID=28133 RepID=UPI000B4D1023|nr:hypothetical protein [Prevotella nigrescens]OWP30251.1 hypothetical protein CBG57_03365 [Prevotella nigrescens]
MKTIHITVSPDMIENGYQPKTTFWMDFSIADKFGIAAIKDTYNRAFKEWKTNHVYLTELVMVLNHKIWQWYQINEIVAQVYNDLWKEADLWAQEHLEGEELDYFYEVTD